MPTISYTVHCQKHYCNAKEMREERDWFDSGKGHELKESCLSIIMDIVSENTQIVFRGSQAALVQRNDKQLLFIAQKM